MKINRNCATVLLGLALCLSVTAAAQTIIDFSGLRYIEGSAPIPNGYAGMNWGNFKYGTEYVSGVTRNVAFPKIGSPSQTMSSAYGQSFQVRGLSVISISGPNVTLTLHGYNQGVFKGSQAYPLSSAAFQQLHVPSEWGQITQLTFVCLTSQGGRALFKVATITLQ